MSELGILDEGGEEKWMEMLTGLIDWAVTTLANDCRNLKQKYEDYIKGKNESPNL